MRIDGIGRAIPGPGGAVSRTGASGGFRLADAHSAGASRAATPLRPAPALDALIALQAIEEDPRERRRRAVKRGHGLLDALDELKFALVDGRGDPAALGALTRRLSERGETSGDSGLDDALSAIELRAAVELAKRGQ